MTHMILTRRFFALAAASAVVTGGALLPATAFAAAPATQHVVAADPGGEDPGDDNSSTLLLTHDMTEDDSWILTDDWDPGCGDHDGDGYGGGVDTGDDWRSHPVCITAPCEL
ncbi:hypothetical protein [Streptomyces sp. NPDC026673]|uniref:hypothetical protein n=1 Tax=Streptomyces sp. NPDC026673 TaxID=3155724 RepID=UPI0033D32D1B